MESAPQILTKGYVAGIKCLKTVFEHTGLLKKLDEKAKSSHTGHYLRSLLATHQLQDMIDLDIPWWSYAAIEEVDKLIKDATTPLEAFEYGSGASTIWLAKRGVKVTAIEHHFGWYEELAKHANVQDNIQLRYVPALLSNNVNGIYSSKVRNFDFTNYVNAIDDNKKQYDIIVIDGRCRNHCFKHALEHIKPSGFIVFDNSDRQRYDLSLNNDKITVQKFKGRVPASPIPGETSIIRLKSS